MNTISNRLAAIATFLAAVAALAGLTVSGLYVDAPNWVQQAQGTDLATLFLAVPVLASGLWTASRGSTAGRLAVVAGLLYLIYNYAIFAFSVAMNSLTAVHIAIFGLSLWSLLLAGRSAVDGAERGDRASQSARGRRAPDRGRCDVRPPVARTDRCGRHDRRPAAGPRQGGHLQQPGLRPRPRVLPAAMRARWRWRPAANSAAGAFAFPMLVWIPLMGAGVVGGIILMAAAGDKTAVPVAVVIAVLAVTSSILAAAAIVRSRAANALVRPVTRLARQEG